MCDAAEARKREYCDNYVMQNGELRSLTFSCLKIFTSFYFNHFSGLPEYAAVNHRLIAAAYGGRVVEYNDVCLEFSVEDGGRLLTSQRCCFLTAEFCSQMAMDNTGYIR